MDALEAAPSLQTTTHNINALRSTINIVSGHQFHFTQIRSSAGPSSTTPSSPPSSNQAPFNDAPVDRLSVHFTGRKKELALIANAFQKRHKVPLRCVLFGNQGVGKS
jgi:hypothetical protein